MELERRASLRSDEGYNSDHSELNQSNERKIHLNQNVLDSNEINDRVQLTTEEVIERDAINFKQKYFVEKLINNSANGVIYKGESSLWVIYITVVIFYESSEKSDF